MVAGSLEIQMAMNLARLSADMSKSKDIVGGAMKSMSSAISSVRNLLGSFGVGIGIGAFGRGIVQAAAEAEQASSRLTAVLKATGNAAGFTKEQLDDMAEAMAASTQFDDEAIRGAEATLLKFGNITGGVFKESLKLSADLAAFLGTDIPEAAQMLGKSVQSPTEGLMMMERQFGKLTDAEEGHIKTLARQGKAVEAQNAVLDLWRAKIGGTADLMNTGLTQATRDVTKSWNEMLEALGKTEVVGGTVKNIFGGIKAVLDDIARMTQKADPITEMGGAITELDLQLKNLEATEERLRTKGGGAAHFAAIGFRDLDDLQAKIEELKEARRVLAQEMTNTMRSGTGGQAGATGGPVTLGGGVTGGLTEADILKKQLESLEAFNEEVRRGNADLNEFLDKPRLESLNRVLAEQAGIWMDIDSAIAQAVISGKAFEEENLATVQKSIELTKEQKALAQDLGFTFDSSFEEAIVSGNKLRDVLEGLYKDLLRILARRLVTEPLAAGITGAIGGIFSGGGAPAFSSGNVIIENTYHIDSRSDQASVMQAVEAGSKRTVAQVSDMMQRGDIRVRP